MVRTHYPYIETTVTDEKITSKLTIPAYEHLYGTHDYNKIPFVPMGMEALIHEKPTSHKTFVEHCKKAYVIGTS